VAVDEDVVVAVIANPDTLNISVSGLKKNVASDEIADPEEEDDGVNNTA
jgi:LEA14-like dessication related protein